MPSHDIIDNRHQKLVDKINCILESSEAAHFAVGYFFISGFTAISDRLNNIKQLRLLIGNTSNRETIEQIAQRYKRLELISDRLVDVAPKDLIVDNAISKQLEDFQKVAVEQAIRNISDYNGTFVADVVRLGKSFIGAAIIKHFEQSDRARPLIICPPPLINI